MRCILETHQLDNCPAFETLIYAWGDMKLVQPIFVNESCINIALSLSVTLQHTRDPQSSRVLWIDALCIWEYYPY